MKFLYENSWRKLILSIKLFPYYFFWWNILYRFQNHQSRKENGKSNSHENHQESQPPQMNGGHRPSKHCHRHHSRSSKAESVLSTMSSDSDIRFTRKKLGDNQKCGCALIAGFLVVLLLAATLFYIGCKYMSKNIQLNNNFVLFHANNT